MARTSFLARGIYFQRASRVRNTHDKGARFKTPKTKTNMAARLFLTTRLTEHKRATKKGDLNNNIAEHKPRYRLGLCYVFNLQYRLLSTNYTRKLVYQLRTNCLKSLSTSTRTFQTFTQQETITPCLLFILQSIYLHNLSPHMSSQISRFVFISEVNNKLTTAG